MQTIHRHFRLQTLSSALLLAGLAGSGLVVPEGVWAQQAPASLVPTPLITFTGDSGDYLGHGGRMPPVLGRHASTQGRLFGVADDSGRYPNSDLVNKRAPSYFYSVALDQPSGSFSSLPLSAYRGEFVTGITGLYFTYSQFSVVETQPGIFLAGLNQYGGTAFSAQNGGSAVRIDVSGTVPDIARAGIANASKVLEVPLVNSALKFVMPNGIHAYDADGNAYFFAYRSDKTSSAVTLLIQQDKQGNYRLVTDLWAEGARSADTQGVFLVADPARGKLYAGLGQTKGSAVASQRGQIVAFDLAVLVSLAAGQDVTAESELLVNFMDAAYGATTFGSLLGFETGQSSSANQSAAVSDGKWLYGHSILDLSSALAGEAGKGVLWRLDLDTKTLQRLHVFGTDTGSTIDGVRPFGPLVRAADGNIYGTTYFGGTGNGGTLFRIKTGDAEDRANDQYEQLASFSGGAAGVAPTGLVAVPALGAQGRLVGTTQYLSGNPELRMPQAQGYGTLYEVRYDLPPVEIRSFTATPSSLTQGDGQGIALNWDVVGSARETPCVVRADSVDYSGVAATPLAPTGTLALDAPTRDGDVTFTLECQTHIDGELTTAKATVAVVPAPVPEPEPQPEPEPEPGQGGDSDSSSGGGGGGLFGLALAMPLVGLALRRRRTARR